VVILGFFGKMKGAGAAGLLAAVVVAMAGWLVWPPGEREVRFLFAELDTALAEAVADDPSVGFLPRAEFETLALEDGETLGVAGRARWFSVGAGAYTLPFIDLRAEIAMEPSFWEVRDGGVAVAQVRIVEARRLATDTAPERSESEANRAGWERLMPRLFDRVAPLGAADLDADAWQIVSVERDGAALVFTLRRGP
jgi:hypothetical protein